MTFRNANLIGITLRKGQVSSENSYILIFLRPMTQRNVNYCDGDLISNFKVYQKIQLGNFLRVLITYAEK